MHKAQTFPVWALLLSKVYVSLDNSFYEKAKELKPDNKALWGNYLLNIYWKLNRAEYDSLEKELGY